MRNKHSTISGILLIISTQIALANTDKHNIESIKCKPTVAYNCTLQDCKKIDIIDIYTSQYFEVDLKNKKVIGSVNKLVTNIDFTAKDSSGENALIFFGSHHRASSPYDWILRVELDNGEMKLTSVSSDEVNTLFGQCYWGAEK